MDSKVELPKDDCFVKMLEQATDLQRKKDEKSQNSNNEEDDLKTNKEISGEEESNSYLENKYEIVEILEDDKTGFQAIIYKDLNGPDYVLAIAGSYPAKSVFHTEWFKDWICNNALVGLGILPPQLKSAISALEYAKNRYRVTIVLGFSQGAIAGALALCLKKYNNIKGFFYNGGAPQKLIPALTRRYGEENVSLDRTNFVTIITNEEPLSKLLTWERGAGVYRISSDEESNKGHSLVCHEGKQPSDYEKTKQASNPFSDSLELSLNEQGNALVMNLTVDIPEDSIEKAVNALFEFIPKEIREANSKVHELFVNAKVKCQNKSYDVVDQDDLKQVAKDVGVSSEKFLSANKIDADSNKIIVRDSQANWVVPEGKHKGLHRLKKLFSRFKRHKNKLAYEDGHWITTKQGNKVFIEDALIEDLKWYYPELEDIPKEDEEIEELNSNSKEVDKNPPLSIMQKGLQMEENPNNEYWYLPNIPLTKVGVFPYYGQQISPNLEPDKLYMVYRPAEEIASEEALKTLELLPVIEDHAMLGTRPGMMPPEEKGIQGITGTEIYCENGVVYGDIKIFTEYLKNVINSGKHEISMGYFCDYDYCSGVYNGQHYDVIQRNLRGNHIAIVDKGRMGEEVCIPTMFNQGVYDGVNTRILVADETVVYSSEVQRSYKSLEEQWQAYLRGE